MKLPQTPRLLVTETQEISSLKCVNKIIVIILMEDLYCFILKVSNAHASHGFFLLYFSFFNELIQICPQYVNKTLLSVVSHYRSYFIGQPWSNTRKFDISVGIAVT